MTDPFRVFPRATATEQAELRTSLKAVGLKNPVVIDEAGRVIDGHERRDGCIELGIDWLAGADVRVGLTDIQKKALGIEMNLWRRPISLSRAQRNELLDIYLIANPQLSEPQVADLFGVDQSTVNRRKRSLTRLHKLEPVESTIGKDGVTRRIGYRQKNGGRVIVKSATEFKSLQPSLLELRDDLHGLQRRPKKLISTAERKRSLALVNRSKSSPLPDFVRIEHCDFRDLKIAKSSVNVVMTDVVWSAEAEKDWCDLAALASNWLKDDGLFCSIIGTQSLPLFCQSLSRHLHYQWTISLMFRVGYRTRWSGIHQRWRPVVVFSKSPKTSRLDGLIDTITETGSAEKDFHDWQQSLEMCKTLIERLTRPGDVIVDPHLGTGTNAVASSLIGQRTFIGCDIDQQQIKTAKYRMATEGKKQPA